MKNTNSAAESGAFIRKTRGYSVVQNEALFNDSLSMSAKGLYALIAARIDYTAVPLTKQWLMNHCTEGERSFNRAWDMLQNNGYLVAHVRPAKHGRFCYEYELRDSNNGWNGVYRRQCDLLWKRQITTLDELLTYKENLQAEYSTLTAQRRALYRGKSKTTPADYSEQIQALTARIRELRREITTCADIEMDCEMVQDKVQRAAHRRENPPRERIHRRAY